jgi:chromosome segregation ATPase
MFNRKANRIAELERVVARVQKRLDAANEQLAGIGGFEYEKVRLRVEGLRAEAEQILRDRLAEKLRHENELAQRKTAQAIALAHARAAVEAELADVRKQIAEARQELRQLEESDELARPASLRPIGVDEGFAPLPRSAEPEPDLRPRPGAQTREDQAAP